ncbi:unnamed protein product, partial [Callosobruchus maculatus]
NEDCLIIYVQEHECLYDLKHKDYDNNLVKDKIWREIANNLKNKFRNQNKAQNGRGIKCSR